MSDSGPGRREVAYRLFAAEFDDAEFSYSESDEERAPNFVVTPTGARVNRLFAVGVLTEVESVNPEMVRGRVVDPTGAFVTYAGQYQPDELAFLERADPPTFLALSGKARTFEPDDGDRIYSSVRPESVSEVDAETRDRWVVTTAERTIERVGVVASAIESDLTGDRLRTALEEAGVDERLADGVALALDYYGTTPAYLEALRETALEALEVVAGERDEVDRLDVAPGEGTADPEGPRGGGGDAAPLATLELSAPEGSEPEPEPDAEVDTETGGATAESPTTADAETETSTETETGTTAAAGAEPDATTETAGVESDTGAVSGTDPAPDDTAEADAGTTSGPGEFDDGDSGEATATTETAAATETGADAEAAESTDQDSEDVELDDDFDPGEFELDEEERREVEEQYGTEFSTADEVEEPGGDAAAQAESGAEAEADSETPTEADLAEEAPTEEAEASADAESAAESEPEPEPEEEAEPDPETADAAEESAESADEADEDDEADAEADAEDVVLEDAVMEAMEELDEGDGADREDLVSTVADRYGALPEDVDDAIQDALMSGRCYEPSDGVLKSI